MIEFVRGNIIESQAEALVNTVNTVGVMGKGIALQFREHFPENYLLYKKACEKGEVDIGKMFITATHSMLNPKWIINFPTKKDWKHRSSYSYISEGLQDLGRVVQSLDIRSIAIPPLGAGQGGLDWGKVKEMILAAFSETPIKIYVYEPGFWAKPVPVKENGSRLTKPRALILAVINQYRKLGYDISLLEIQKLAYFLQRSGQFDLKLNFRKYYYGPYAHNLQHLLHALENDYLITEKPVLDSKPLDIIYIRPGKVDEIEQYIESHCSPEEKQRLETIGKIIHGFESPFGLELLASVEWIIHEYPDEKELSPEVLKSKLAQWSQRKAGSFSLGHIELASKRLTAFKEQLINS